MLLKTPAIGVIIDPSSRLFFKISLNGPITKMKRRKSAFVSCYKQEQILSNRNSMLNTVST